MSKRSNRDLHWTNIVSDIREIQEACFIIGFNSNKYMRTDFSELLPQSLIDMEHASTVLMKALRRIGKYERDQE